MVLGLMTLASSAWAQPKSASKAPLPWSGTKDAEASETLPEFLRVEQTRSGDQRKPPTPTQIKALREMEEEVGRFSNLGSAYHSSILSVVRRDYERQRRTRDAAFARQIHVEESLEDAARLRAIALFERFIAQYPDDPRYTPDAMFRLGELYFERSALAFQKALDSVTNERDTRREANQSAEDLRDPEKDFGDTIELYKKLIERFPKYERIAGVYYLIGYCLNEEGDFDAARIAWLSLACHNHFDYRRDSPKTPDKTQTEEDREEHPALGLETQRPSTTLRDSYADCEPVASTADFYAETWLRIGEYHFDFDYGDDALERAISAYSKILAYPDNRVYNLALYKLAWSYYRASRYPQSIRHFALLVQWSDDEKKRTGKAGTELRAEAIQYLGIAFAYDDWNENQILDPQEGLPTGLERIQSQGLLPQDQDWTSEVYFQLGTVYFDEAKYPQAIAAWELALKRFPNHYRAPEIQNQIAVAYIQNNQLEQGLGARALLSERYREGTEWWNANMDHPKEQRAAEQLAQDALIGTAIQHHQHAQNLRRKCVQDEMPELCRESQQAYGLAADAYKLYIDKNPNSPQAYELHYNWAEALYWSERYEQAAQAYAAVRDSNLDDTHLSEAARRVVESLKRIVDREVQANRITVRSEPPVPTGTPPRVAPLEMPVLVQRLAQAREVYLARVDAAHDTESVRDSYNYNNALLLYVYGYWGHARDRFARIFDENCSGEGADETGRVAWYNLNNMAVSLNQTSEVERLSKDLQKRRCTFASGGVPSRSVDCAKAENQEEPQCIATVQLSNIRYQKAVQIFEEAEKAKGADQRRLYEEAATMLVQAVNDEPKHAQAPLALEKAAVALERTSRFESAARLYARIIDEVGPRAPKDEEEAKRLDAILSNAYFRQAYNANRFFDFERAVSSYRALADSERFSKSQEPVVRERREDALINAARILEYQQQYKAAAEYYRRGATIISDEDDRRSAQYRVAEMAYKQGDWNLAIREMRDFIKQYGADPKAGALIVQAYWRIAEAQKAKGITGREYRAALEDVVSAFGRTGQTKGSVSAEYAAESQFRLVEEGAEAFETFAIKPGNPPTMDAYIKKGLLQEIESGSNRAASLAAGYDAIPAYGRPNWTIAAFVRQGRIYEVLARAVLNTPFVVPKDLNAQLKRLGPEQKEEVRVQIEDRIRQVLDERVRPIECLAVARYALAARAAQAGSMDTEHTRIAIDRLQAYGDERIAECLAQAKAQDATFGAYEAGEFSRAPRGQTLPLPSGTAPPAMEVKP